jgi:choline kinase
MVAIVYMAAGMSSRFGGFIKGLTKITNEQTLIEVSLDEALPAGYDQIILIVSELTKPAFETHFGKAYNNIPVTYVIQPLPKEREKPWGTTHAVIQLIPVLQKSFVVLNSDDIYGKESLKLMYEAAKKNVCATIGYKLGNVLPDSGEVNRGIFEVENNFVTTITETLNISRDNLEAKNLSRDSLTSMNIFALTPNILKLFEEQFNIFYKLNIHEPKKESILAIELCTLIQEQKMTLSVHPTEDTCLGVTWQEDIEAIKNALQKIKKN